MRVKVVVGFVDKNSFTHLKGEVKSFDDAYATELVDLGKVAVVEEATSKKTNARKASNARKTILPRRGR